MTFEQFPPRFKLGAGLLAIALGLSNCSFAPPPSPVRPSPRPAVYSPQQILAHLKRRAEQIKSCQTLAHLEIDSWGESKNLKAALVLQSPASLRLEFLSFLGQPWQFLVCHGGNFWFYSPLQQKVMSGAATRFNLYRLLGINLELEEIVNILLARPTLLPSSSPVLVQYLPGENKYLLQISDPQTGKEQNLWLDAASLSPRQLIIRQQQQLEMEVRWDDYQAIDSLPFPTTISIQRPQEATEVRIKYSDSKLNRDVAAEMFSLDIPSHAEWVKLPGSGSN